jgi:O-antigen ligase
MDEPAHAEPVRLTSVIQSGLAVAAVLVFYTGCDSYFFTLGGPKPKVLVVVFAAIVACAFVIDPHRPRPSLRSPLLLWLVFYLGTTIAWVPFMKGYDEVWQTLYDRCRSIVTVFSLALVFDDPRARRAAVLTIAPCIVLASAVNVAELLSLITFEAGPERIAGRSSGFYMDPNGAALAITLGLVLIIEEIRPSWRMPLIIVSTFGVAATFSRQGLVCLGLAFVWMVWRKAIEPRAVTLGTAAAVVLLVLAIAFASSSGLLNDETAARLRLGGSDSGRIELARKAWHMFLAAPWTGKGLGATRIWEGDQGAHNMFLALAAEQGILGLLTLPALGAALLWSRRGAAGFVLLLMAFGLFTHNLLDSRHTLLLIALAATSREPAPPTPDLVGDRRSRLHRLAT